MIYRVDRTRGARPYRTFRFRHSGFVSWLLKGVTTWRKKGHVAQLSPRQLGRTIEIEADGSGTALLTILRERAKNATSWMLLCCRPRMLRYLRAFGTQ